MMVLNDAVVRNVRNVLKVGTRIKLKGKGRRRTFMNLDTNSRFKGLTKRLEKIIHSDARMPVTRGAHVRRTRTELRRWKGKNAGRNRGIDIDKELTRVANSRVGKMLNPKNLHRLTRLALVALERDGLRLVCGQHAVCDDARRVATACDLVCIRTCDDDDDCYELVLVEVKTGYDDKRMNHRFRRGGTVHMRGALSCVPDSWCHRHMCQLACTWHMFVNNREMMECLCNEINVRDVSGMLLYLTEKDVEAIALPEWWACKAEEIVSEL